MNYSDRYGTGPGATLNRGRGGVQEGATVGSALGPYGALIGGIAGGLRGLLEGPGAYESANLRQLDALSARREAGALGLTEKEKAMLYGEQDARVRQGDEQLQRQQGGALATGVGMGAGQAFNAASRTQDRRNLAQQQIAQSVLSEDIAEQGREEEEYWARLASVEGRQEERKQQSQERAEEGAQALQYEQAFGDMAGGDDPAAARNELMSTYGMSGEEADGWLQQLANNPELETYLSRFGG